MPDVAAGGDQWSVLVPVKRLEIAKSRLAVPAEARADLALAMAVDTVRAVLAARSVGEVVVITDDSRATTALVPLGARLVADLPDAGLNPALVHGASVAARSRVAALSSDLPALRPADLDTVLAVAGQTARSVVADASGTGTTMLSAIAMEEFEPKFGHGSLAAHVDAGAADLTELAAESVRHDVDNLDALRSALRLGVVDETRRVAAKTGIAAAGPHLG